ncbi:MAG: DAK2 domain-containing protein [Acholeplasmatales bacterium]|jgi:DAK2 domain fusion protein YloV|nr:DAK2 domain-containing protein [Acholeplasmatales bacterium]
MGNNKTLSAELFKKIVKNGAINLKNNHEEIDHLNVFPVPDGDTGTNMQMTMMAGINEIETVESNSIIDISKILSRGLLYGARGNSGVILSQFFRGLSSEISKIGNINLTVKDFIHALVGGYEMAYKAVSTPVEGTILTVVRESAEHVSKNENNYDSIESVLDDYLVFAKETLKHTPELLPVLKEAGVVDSGGAGFIKVIEGMKMALDGKILTENETSAVDAVKNGIEALGEVDIKYGYCTEFIVKLNKPDEFDPKGITNTLLKMGDSLVVVNDEDLLKVHVHVNEPGEVLTLAQKFGDLQKVKIENMRIQHSEIIAPTSTNKVVSKQKVEIAIIAVASGSGMKDTFKGLGVDYIVDGGQTMNPPAEDFINAIKKVNAKHVIILPNNSNVILAAEQASKLIEDSNTIVLKTKNEGEGYSALFGFDPSVSVELNVENMNEAYQRTTSGEITYSIRDVVMDGISVKKGDYIGISKSKMTVANKSKVMAAKALITKMSNEYISIINIITGADVTEKEINSLQLFASKKYPDAEIEIIEGKQEVYSFIVTVE